MDTRLKYVYIDSRTKKSTDKKNNMTIEIPQTLDNCTRFALKSFSIANVFPNMIDKKIQWVEFLQTGLLTNVIWKAALFEINFIDLAEDQIYLDNLSLQLNIQTQFTNASGNKIFKTDIDNSGYLGAGSFVHQVDTETTMPITINYNPTTYKFSLYGNQESKHKIVVLYDDNSGGSLWKSMGFEKHKLMTKDDIPDFLTKLGVYSDAHPAGLPGAELFNVNTSFTDEFHMRDMYNVASNTIALKTIHAPFTSCHENDISEINVCSDLAECFLTSANGKCIPTDIVEKVVNNVPKFSYLHHQADTLYFHQLSKNNIKTFNIRLDDHNYKPIDERILPDWSAVVIFEQTFQVIDHHDDIINYKEKAYEMGHPVLRR